MRETARSPIWTGPLRPLQRTYTVTIPTALAAWRVLITPSAIIGKSTDDIVEDFLNEAVPDWAGEPARP
jgi:hypothetical protein